MPETTDPATTATKNPYAQQFWVATCAACCEKALVPFAAGPCPLCGEEGQVTFKLDDKSRNLEAQTLIVGALWDVARQGPPLDEKGRVRHEFLPAVGSALEQIMGAFGLVVTPVQ